MRERAFCGRIRRDLVSKSDGGAAHAYASSLHFREGKWCTPHALDDLEGY